VVDAPVAVNKDVIYESDNPDVVKVDANGKLTAISEGTAVITVTTVSGGVTDTCVVTVEKGVLPLAFDFEGAEGITLVNGIYVISTPTINIASYLKVSDEVNIEDVVIKIQSGSSATLEGGILTFDKAERLVTIRAYVGNEEKPDYIAEIKIVYEAK
jgi:hypothetical protein